MESLLARALAALLAVQNLAMAGVLAAFLALALRSFVLPFVDCGRWLGVTVLRLLAGAAFSGAAAAYALFTAQVLDWNGQALAVAFAVGALVLLPLGLRHVWAAGRAAASGPRRAGAPRPAPRPRPTAALVQLCLLLALLLVAVVTLMSAGFTALSEDRPVLLVDVTGETGARLVRWAAPDQPPREERLRTHRVVFRTPDGRPVAEAWLYGDEVAVKGRVLRLSPLLSAAGVPNLFELLFAFNGYRTVERHNAQPHTAVPLPALGPLEVHPWWRPLQTRLLERWEKGTPDDSVWLVRSVTTESTFFPLVDAQGRPVRQMFRLVLTPGGLSAS